ncbi:DUF6265 family protein [Flavobacterium sp.]|uniref:DUF6265 family protein n=1 Tax=Flavobacterium sp. TaxID=239 RepID=UPI0038FCD2B7
MTSKSLLLFLLILLIFACENSNKNAILKKSNWLIGKWERNSAKGNLKEIWKPKNDSTFIGESYFIKGKDTLHFENIQIQQTAEDLAYISTIMGQNKDKPITFIQNKEEEKQLVFENLTNDYPQKITYSKISKDRIMIQISGIQQGKLSSDRYILKKIN